MQQSTTGPTRLTHALFARKVGLILSWACPICSITVHYSSTIQSDQYQHQSRAANEMMEKSCLLLQPCCIALDPVILHCRYTYGELMWLAIQYQVPRCLTGSADKHLYTKSVESASTICLDLDSHLRDLTTSHCMFSSSHQSTLPPVGLILVCNTKARGEPWLT